MVVGASCEGALALAALPRLPWERAGIADAELIALSFVHYVSKLSSEVLMRFAHVTCAC